MTRIAADVKHARWGRRQLLKQLLVHHVSTHQPLH